MTEGGYMGNPFDPLLNTQGLDGYIPPPDYNAIGARDMGANPFGGSLVGNGGVDASGTHGTFPGGSVSGGSQFPTIIPIPGIGLGTAIGASILLSGGIPNPLQGGASPSQVLDRTGQIIVDPIGTTGQTATHVGNQLGSVFGGPVASQTDQGINGGGIIIPDGTGSGGSNVLGGSSREMDILNSAGIGPNQNGGTTVVPIDGGVGQPNEQPPSNVVPGTGDNPGNTNIVPTISTTAPVGPVSRGMPEPNPPSITLPPITNPGTPTTPTTPTTPAIPPVIVAPVNLPKTTMPTGTPPDPRNYYSEGLQGTNAYNMLGQGMFNNYATYAPQYGQNDLNTLGSLFGLQGNQTIQGINSAAQRGLQGSTTGDLQNMAQQQLALGSSLSPQQLRAAQQASRAADSARGLAMGPNSVQNEILMQDQYGQQLLRQRQGFALAANPQIMANSAYLMDTGANYASGRNSNNFIQNQANPFNAYANDLYGSNFNAGNAQYISAQNNAAALAAGRQVQNTNYADMFMNALYGIGTQKGWFR